jgi:hypothetical protein
MFVKSIIKNLNEIISWRYLMERIFRPTRYDSAPYRTICRVKGECDVIHEYIQLNDDETNPQWIPVGDFLYRAFSEKLYNQEFLDECIKNYHGSYHKGAL